MQSAAGGALGASGRFGRFAGIPALTADLPLPGGGRTAERFSRLADIAAADLVTARLAEAHADASAILVELGSEPVRPQELWGVWASEATPVTASVEGSRWYLRGRKSWCSGATTCSHALITAGDVLWRVELGQPGVEPQPTAWRGPGLSGADTADVVFVGVAAHPVGRPGDYLRRPGFWHGAIGVAACWYGGSRAVAATLVRAHTVRPLHAHALAHLGAVDAALSGARSTLFAAAAEIDAAPDRDAHRLALGCRAVVERAASDIVERVGRALGPAPLATDADHAQRVADLAVYLRQSHAERDLEALGRLVVAEVGAGDARCVRRQS